MTKITDLVRPNILQIKPYVPGKPIEEVERELGITNVIKLASNENPLGPSPKAVAAMKQAVEKVNLYPDGACFYLKQALAAHLGIAPECLIIGNGSDELLKLIAETFLREGDEVIIANPSFGEYEFVTRVMGAEPVMVELQNYTHDLMAMAGKIGPRTRLVFVCNPNNPTGTIVTKTEVDEFMTKVPEDVVVVFDEAYYEYVSDDRYPQTIEFVRKGRRVIVLRTFSKIYGLAGLRVGYGIADPEIIACLGRVREPFNVNLVAQAAALAALDDQEHVQKSRAVNQAGRDYLYHELAAMGLECVPTEANFMLVHVRTEAQDVFQKLMREGVIVRPGGIFGYPQHIRVTIGTTEENERFVQALRKVLAS
ncbi:MAG: histidinol-phosphate transaminase [Firmicutes bacterium]|nr:histidinol-phosphate transaminase [Bacillota bacterium]